jgi:hypothetical protein
VCDKSLDVYIILRRQPKIIGVQFRGGVNSAREVIKWLDQRGYLGHYEASIEGGGELSERVWFGLRGTNYTLLKSDWYVIEGDPANYIPDTITNEQFEARYEKVVIK